jgi:hypothetical protein
MQDFVSEPIGFRFTLAGGGAWIVGLLSQLDITQVLGFIGIVVGILIQIAAYYRNRKSLSIQEAADTRAKEADERGKLLHDLQRELLLNQIAEIKRKSEGE